MEKLILVGLVTALLGFGGVSSVLPMAGLVGTVAPSKSTTSLAFVNCVPRRGFIIKQLKADTRKNQDTVQKLFPTAGSRSEDGIFQNNVDTYIFGYDKEMGKEDNSFGQLPMKIPAALATGGTLYLKFYKDKVICTNDDMSTTEISKVLTAGSIVTKTITVIRATRGLFGRIVWPN